MNEKEKDSFIDFVKSTLRKETLNESGTLLYSSFNTLKKGRFLILGINPGGNPDDIKATILDTIINSKIDDISDYYKDWDEEDKKHRLQENLKKVSEVLNFNLNKVCATNLFFSRTKEEKTLHWDELDESLKVHEEIIKRVSPEIILIFGKVPFDEYKKFFRKKLNYKIENLKDIRSGHGKWMIRRFIAHGKNKIKVIGLPHLSVYTIYNRPNKLDWLKNEVNNHKP